MGFLSKIFHRNRLELKDITDEEQDKPFVNKEEEEAAKDNGDGKKVCDPKSSPFLDDC